MIKKDYAGLRNKEKVLEVLRMSKYDPLWKYLKENKRFKELPENLKEIAEVRLKNPDASLVELGQMLKNPIGKSGVNHRLKKISEIAEGLKGEQNGD